MSVATITQGPAAGDGGFIGWFIKPGGQPQRIGCDPAYWVTTGQYGTCEGNASGQRYVPTSVSGSFAYAPSVTGTCPGQPMSSFIVLSSSPINPNDPAQTAYGCLPTNWSANTVYRTLLLTSSFSTSSTTAASQTSQAPSAQSSQSSSSASKTWIVGAVVGPLVLLALVIGSLFYILRMKSRHAAEVQDLRRSMIEGGAVPDSFYGKQHHSKPETSELSVNPADGDNRLSVLEQHRASPTLSELP